MSHEEQLTVFCGFLLLDGIRITSSVLCRVIDLKPAHTCLVGMLPWRSAELVQIKRPIDKLTFSLDHSNYIIAIFKIDVMRNDSLEAEMCTLTNTHTQAHTNHFKWMITVNA